MDAVVPRPLTPTTRIQLVLIHARADDRWSLLSDYVDRVWTELLGVTTVAVARRLGQLRALASPARGVSLDFLATSLRVPPSKVLDALRRLHHHRLIEFREHTAVIGWPGPVGSRPRGATERVHRPARCRAGSPGRVAATPARGRAQQRGRARYPAGSGDCLSRDVGAPVPQRRVRGDPVCPRAPIGCLAVVVAGPPRRLGSPDLPVFRIGCRPFFVSGTLAGSPAGNLRCVGRPAAARLAHNLWTAIFQQQGSGIGGSDAA